jgi:hypothetical protein
MTISGNSTHQDKNPKTIKKTLSIMLVLLFVQSVICSQLLDNKLNFYASYGKTMAIGNEYITEGSYTTPSLFNNYNNANNLGLKALYKWKSYFSVGLWFNSTKFSDWQNSSSSLFSGSEAKIMALGPVLSLHTKYRKEKLFNRFYASASFSPVFNLITVDLEQSPYQVDGADNQNDLLHSETSNF